ncbi:MAG: hypothetical protein WCU00_00415 [Candidatus Latescibacterota bacterium]
MDQMISNIMVNIKGINFEGPAMFVIIVLALLAVFRKWSIVLVSLLMIVLGWGAQDLMITNIKTSLTIVSIPLIIYGAGGVIILVLILYSLYKSGSSGF